MHSVNPGISKSVISVSLLIIALIGSYLFKKNAKLNKYNWFGCILIVLGVGVMSQINKKGKFLI